MRRTVDVLEDDLDALTDRSGGGSGASAQHPTPLQAALPQAAPECALADLALRQDALVCGLGTDPLASGRVADPAADSICRRLDALGFVPGERVRVSSRGPFGGDPLVVDIGTTRFALRRSEARRVRVVPVADDRQATP